MFNDFFIFHSLFSFYLQKIDPRWKMRNIHYHLPHSFTPSLLHSLNFPSKNIKNINFNYLSTCPLVHSFSSNSQLPRSWVFCLLLSAFCFLPKTSKTSISITCPLAHSSTRSLLILNSPVVGFG